MTDPQPEAAVLPDAELGPTAPQRRMISLGAIALTAVAALAVVEIVAIIIGTAGEWAIADALGKAVIVLTVATLLLGIVAAVRRRGGRLGAVAAVVSILINPLVLIGLLHALGGS
ncbi:hypothetical protein [Lacisediminihabitans changchengi]|uniref:Uncharacterized protein n=1 Tax=Lacisediminihabitans changchengi TaxID=2787634 RepID=A0A934SP43_9MICO|nr:hypothetical protein [Lacisediminihabitans changchengi]MBK4349016.1 hypothetical protein [Lacisediminihabitans changchengi]